MLRLVAIFLALLGAAVPAAAQFNRLPSMDQPRGNAIVPELVINARAAPGRSAELAILMHVKPGWHGYWRNPGDAGLPMSIDWQLPAGWRVSEPDYPVPSRLLVSGIVNYVYERDYALLARLRVPAGATGSHTIRAKMRWLACTDKVCVPEEGEAKLSVPTGGMAAPDRRFDEWRRALPRPLSSLAHYAVDDNKLRIGIPLPETLAIADPYLFPATEGVVDYAKPQRFSRNGPWVVSELDLTEAPTGEIEGVLAVGGGQGFAFRAVPGGVPKRGSVLGGEAGGAALAAALFGALLGGLFLNLMPCVFPILAMKALHLARAGGDQRAARREALSYAAGAVIGTAALGGLLLLIRAGGSAAGWAFQLQDPRTTLLLLLIAVAVTLNLLKAFELPVLAGEASPAGSFGTGVLAAFVATPCSGPFMGAALGAALLLPLAGSVVVFAALGLGLALPFVAIAFIPPLRRRLPRPGPWMGRLQRFLAVPMAATVVATLWLLYRQAGQPALAVGLLAALALALTLLWLGRRQVRGGRFGMASTLLALAIAAGAAVALPQAGSGIAHTPIGTHRWSNDGVARARAAGHPVFVYFTADWCLTCKANEAAAIDRAETARAFREAGVETFVGDWTNGDPAIGRFLESRGRAGVPLYLWYAPGKAEPEELPQILTPGMLSERARAAADRAP